MTWRFEDSTPAQADRERFLAALNAHADFFSDQAPLWSARAPGRLDLMGGIADYSGSLVLELPLAVATWAAVQSTDRQELVIMSTDVDAGTSDPQITLPLAELQDADYTTAHTLLTANPRHAWAAYVAGVLVVLHRERGLRLEQGLRIFIHSEVPAGKGVSSSAALEVATMYAVCALHGLQMTGRDLALLCQQVENLIVGAPCGIMDQMTSACGEQDSLLSLLCQPAELQPAIALPEDIEVWGIDSGIRHAVSGADYGSVRVAAFMGYSIIAQRAGLNVQQQRHGYITVDDPIWHGYLANVTPSQWETRFREHVPPLLMGVEFLHYYGGITDSVTSIVPNHIYSVQRPTAHPIYEHHRVQLFRALLALPTLHEEQRQLLGELMYQSHASYSACRLGSTGTDRLVELVREAGPSSGLYGAKITGGGSGGTVAVLARRGSRAQIERIADQYAQETDHAIEILGGSSPGAVAYGPRRLIPG